MTDDIGTLRWFGESWGAPVCDPRAHVSIPVGMECAGHDHMHETRSRVIEQWDSGVMIPFIPGPGEPIEMMAYHLQCWLHEVGADRLMVSTEDDDDGIDWAEVARTDRESRGECWYRADIDGMVTDWYCGVHHVVHPRESDK